MFNDMYGVVSNKNIFKLPKYIIILLIFLLMVFIFLINYKVSLYDSYNASVTKIGEDYYVKVYMEYDQSSLLDNNQIYIDSDLYNYKIYRIDEPMVINDNLYLNVYLDIKLDENKKINNYPLVMKQELKKETVFTIILNKIRKELNV